MGTKPTKLTRNQLPAVRAKMLAAQGGFCPLCNEPLRGKNAREPVLDHDHCTGYVRDVLCRNCNGIEGRILHYAARGARSGNDPVEFVKRLLAYWDKHSTPQTMLLHPTHQTEEEKRNATLRKRRATYARRKQSTPK